VTTLTTIRSGWSARSGGIVSCSAYPKTDGFGHGQHDPETTVNREVSRTINERDF
jgi:hypothetical protein